MKKVDKENANFVIPLPITHCTKLTLLLGNRGIDFLPLPVYPEMVHYQYGPLKKRLLELIGKEPDEEKRELKEKAFHGKILRGVGVFFWGDRFLEMDCFSALSDHLGVPDLLFAHVSMFDKAAREKNPDLVLATSLIATYGQEGRQLTIHPSLLPSSLSCSPKSRLVINVEENGLPWINEISDCTRWLRNPPFPELDDSIFSEIWEKMRHDMHDQVAGSPIFSSLFVSKEELVVYRFLYWGKQQVGRQEKEALASLIHQVAQNEDNIEAGFRLIEEIILWEGKEYLIADYFTIQARCKSGQVNTFEDFLGPPLTASQTGRLVMAFLIGYDQNKPERWIYLNDEQLWPLSECRRQDESVGEACERLFLLLVNIWLDLAHSQKLTFNRRSLPILAEEESPLRARANAFGLPRKSPEPMSCGHLVNYPSESIKRIEAFEGFNDYYGVEGLTIPIEQLVFLEELLSQSPTFSSGLHGEVSQGVATLLSAYRDYFTIPAKEIPFRYGSRVNCFSSLVRDTHQNFATSLQGICDLLLVLDKKPPLAAKCFEFFVVAMESALSIAQRRQRLSKSWSSRFKGLPVPYLCKDFFHDLVLLNTWNFHAETLQLLVSLASSPEELRALVLLMNERAGWRVQPCEILRRASQSKDARRVLHLTLTSFVNHYLRRNCSTAELRLMLDDLMMEDRAYNGGSRFEYAWYKIGVAYLKEALQGEILIRECERFMPCELSREVEDATSFSFTQVFQASFQEDRIFYQALQKGDAKATSSRLASFSKTGDLQMCNQCSEHATGRDPVEAVLLETLQNSVDALCSAARQGNFKTDPVVSFEIERLKTNTTEAQLILRIADSAGFPSIQTLFTHLMIPNYSGKWKEEGVIGTMGNGFFQLLGQASCVTLLTRTLDTERVYYVRMVPQRDSESGEVVDVYVKCAEVTPRQALHRGTEVSILFLQEPKEKVALKALNAVNIIRTTLAQTQITLPNGTPIVLFLKHHDGKMEPLNAYSERSTFDTEIVPGLVTSYRLQQLKSRTSAGYTLTAGLPCAPLAHLKSWPEKDWLPASLLERYFSKGWALYVPKDAYNVVQSRDRLLLKDHTRKEELVNFLMETLYWRCLCDEEGEPSLRYFSHLESPSGAFDQIRPSAKSISNEDLLKQVRSGQEGTLSLFFCYYKPNIHTEIKWGSFVEWIERGYSELLPKLRAEVEIAKAELQKLEKGRGYEVKVEYGAIKMRLDGKLKEVLLNWVRGCESEIKGGKLTPAIEALCLGYFDKVVRGWFERKLPNYRDSELLSYEALLRRNPTLCNEEEKRKKEEGERTIQAVFGIKGDKDYERLGALVEMTTELLTLYCQLTYSLLKTKGEAPKVHMIAKEEEPSAGFYRRLNHTITINLFYSPLSTIFCLFADLSQGVVPTAYYERPLFFVGPGNSGFLNHELEHARRSEECTSTDSHGLGLSTNGELVHFEACATSWALLAHERGAVSKLMEALPDVLAKYGSTTEELRQTAVKLSAFERSCNEQLADFYTLFESSGNY